MSIALKLEPRWPEPARFTAVSAFARAMSAEQRQAVVARHVGDADALELAAGDQRELDHGCHGSTSIRGRTAPAATRSSARAQSSS